MATEQQRRELLDAAIHVNRMKADYELALVRFNLIIDQIEGNRAAASASSVKTSLPSSSMRKGKAPNPQSVNQQVLALLTQSGSRSIVAMAEALNISVKQARNAVAYHQKRGALAHTGEPGVYDLKGRMNGAAGRSADANT